MRRFVFGGMRGSSELPLVFWEFELPLDELGDGFGDAAFRSGRFGVLAFSGLLKVLFELLLLAFGDGIEVEVRSSQLLDVEGA